MGCTRSAITGPIQWYNFASKTGSLATKHDANFNAQQIWEGDEYGLDMPMEADPTMMTPKGNKVGRKPGSTGPGRKTRPTSSYKSSYQTMPGEKRSLQQKEYMQKIKKQKANPAE